MTDLTQPMIDYARAKPGTLAAIDWRTADAAALPFDSTSFGALAFGGDLPFRSTMRALVVTARAGAGPIDL